MKIAYIDDDEVRSTAFFQAARQVHGSIDCNLLKDGANTINYLLNTKLVLHCIFIHFEFKDMSCETIIRLIKNQEHLDHTEVIVISDHFTRTEGLLFKDLNVTTRLVSTEGLTEALSDIFNSRNGAIRSLSNK